MEVQRQLEYYFSDLNFPRDRFLRAEAANDPLGEETVAISVLLTFKKLVALGADAGALREAARASPLLVLREAEPRAAAAEEATAAGEAGGGLARVGRAARGAPAGAPARVYDHVVLDAGALIRAASLTAGLARRARAFWTVPEVLAEVRDARSRAALDALPFELAAREPPPAACRAVAAFARKTGDFRALSATDLKVLALTYALETDVNLSLIHI